MRRLCSLVLFFSLSLYLTHAMALSTASTSHSLSTHWPPARSSRSSTTARILPSRHPTLFCLSSLFYSFTRDSRTLRLSLSLVFHLSLSRLPLLRILSLACAYNENNPPTGALSPSTSPPQPPPPPHLLPPLALSLARSPSSAVALPCRETSRRKRSSSGGPHVASVHRLLARLLHLLAHAVLRAFLERLEERNVVLQLHQQLVRETVLVLRVTQRLAQISKHRHDLLQVHRVAVALVRHALELEHLHLVTTEADRFHELVGHHRAAVPTEHSSVRTADHCSTAMGRATARLRRVRVRDAAENLKVRGRRCGRGRRRRRTGRLHEARVLHRDHGHERRALGRVVKAREVVGRRIHKTVAAATRCLEMLRRLGRVLRRVGLRLLRVRWRRELALLGQRRHLRAVAVAVLAVLVLSVLAQTRALLGRETTTSSVRRHDRAVVLAQQEDVSVLVVVCVRSFLDRTDAPAVALGAEVVGAVPLVRLEQPPQLAVAVRAVAAAHAMRGHVVVRVATEQRVDVAAVAMDVDDADAHGQCVRRMVEPRVHDHALDRVDVRGENRRRSLGIRRRRGGCVSASPASVAPLSRAFAWLSKGISLSVVR